MLGDQEEFRPRRRRSGQRVLGQSIDRNKKLVSAQQNVEDTQGTGPCWGDPLLPQFTFPSMEAQMDTPSPAGIHAEVVAELAAHLGYIKALEYGLRAAIAAHPAAEAMSLLWAQMLPEISDSHASAGHVAFNAALQHGLRVVGAQIDEASAGTPLGPVMQPEDAPPIQRHHSIRGHIRSASVRRTQCVPSEHCAQCSAFCKLDGLAPGIGG